MVCKQHSYTRLGRNAIRTMALFLCLLAGACAYAQDTVPAKKKWLDDYPKHVGFTWDAQVKVVANYLWRGVYVGGLALQPSAQVGYGGLYLDMWWNIGSYDWTFKHNPANARVKGFNPEVDLTIGFSRWGLTVYYMHMYYFDTYNNGDKTTYINGGNSRFFDFSNPAQGGITQEWGLSYRVSDKLPLSILVATRTWGRDGYTNDNGERKRAYSTYIELGYDFSLPWQLMLEARLGMTPNKSIYTGYQTDFAVVNVSAKLSRSWQVSQHCDMNVFAQMMINPYDVSESLQKNTTYQSVNGGRQVLWNVGWIAKLK